MKTESGEFIGDIVLSDDTWSSPKAVVRGFSSRDMSNNENAPRKRESLKCTAIGWEELNLDTSSDNDSGVVMVAEERIISTKAPMILILCESEAGPSILALSEKLTTVLKSLKCTVSVATTKELGSEKGSGLLDLTVISLVEADNAAVARWTELDFMLLKDIIWQTSAMLWVTRGGQYASQESLHHSLTTGLLRTIRAEMPQLRLPHLDLPEESDLAHEHNVDAIVVALEASIFSGEAIYEQEFVVKGDKILVPRLRQEPSFHQELSSYAPKPQPYLSRIVDLGSPMQAVIDTSTKEIVWQHADIITLGANDVEILISAINVEPTDLIETSVIGRDAIGTVTKIGSGVEGFTFGDKVVLCASHTLRTSIIIQSDLIRRLPAFVDANLVVTLPSALCTVQAAWMDLGHLKAGQTVIIATSPGIVERALISLATQIGAEVFVIAHNLAHERILVEDLGIEENCVILSSVISGSPAIKLNKEVDLVVSTLNGEFMQEAMEYLSDFG